MHMLRQTETLFKAGRSLRKHGEGAYPAGVETHTVCRKLKMAHCGYAGIVGEKIASVRTDKQQRRRTAKDRVLPGCDLLTLMLNIAESKAECKLNEPTKKLY